MGVSAARSCDGCGTRPVAYRRPYSGQSLCAHCFSKSIVHKAKATIDRYRMLREGDRILVAVSGGKDSLSLLHVLSQLVGRHRSALLAVTIDEGIPGYREESIAHARRLCEALGVEHHVYSLKELFGVSTEEAAAVPLERRPPACTICGVLRRRALEVVAKELGADVLATAHNLDDVVQTFMINLLTGNLANLKKLDPELPELKGVFVRRAKPFMEIYEEEVAFYAYLNGLPLQSERCPHVGEGLRDKVRGFLNALERESPGIKYVLYNSFMELSRRLVDERQGSLRSCRACGRPSSGEVCAACRVLGYLGLQPEARGA
jgi:cytoplasmic tRNA 2-thiolation protein 1